MGVESRFIGLLLLSVRGQRGLYRDRASPTRIHHVGPISSLLPAPNKRAPWGLAKFRGCEGPLKLQMPWRTLGAEVCSERWAACTCQATGRMPRNLGGLEEHVPGSSDVCRIGVPFCPIPTFSVGLQTSTVPTCWTPAAHKLQTHTLCS